MYPRRTMIRGILFVIILLSPIAASFVMQVPSPPDLSLAPESVDFSLPRQEASSLPLQAMVPVAPSPGARVVVIVEHALYASVADSVLQYCKDLNDTGYSTILYTAPLATHQELKSNLTSWYSSDNIVGAVLIGRLPYAEYHHPADHDFSAETFICDLYLMDLDGSWYDGDPIDGIYDSHSALPGADIYPEIFVARIDPTCLSWGPDTAGHVNAYLERLHDYRTGDVQRSRRGLMYIDDDWAGYWGSRWATDLGILYQTRTVVRVPTTYTNATDWLNNRLTQDYQWGHLCAHSSPTTHYFGPGGSGEGTASSTQIRSVPPAFNFYNLFCCSGAEWTTPNNLGVTYLFSGPYSLAAVGSTKTGSMMDCDRFYAPLAENLTLGESLVDWFGYALRTESSAGLAFLEWYYGMTILGDPLLTTYYDCTVISPTVTSTSHPDPEEWYDNSLALFNWTTPPDVNNITGYYYIIDQSPTTAPTSETGTFTTDNGLEVDMGLGDGTWYFHLVARDSVNNTGQSPTHFRLNIDTSSPEVSLVFPSPLQNYTSGNVLVSWQVTDSGSGYQYADVYLDGHLEFSGDALSFLADALEEGLHTVNVTAYDLLGHSVTSTTVAFRVDTTDPEIDDFTVAATVLPDTPFSISWSVTEHGSGYAYAEVYLDEELLSTVIAPEFSLSIEGLSQGTYTLSVIVYDWSGRNAVAQASISAQPPIAPLLLMVGGLAVVVVAAAALKRRT
jgi:hypothetical protein